MIDENLHWHVEYVYNHPVKYFGLFNHVKIIISKKYCKATLFCFYTFVYEI